ncbi:MAG: hypothetical protein PWQ97_727 [Tepidanaerobacteraceae bacterium]|nr:hypothetical protein [Tepidanaerobacteraceae bacterium]
MLDRNLIFNLLEERNQKPRYFNNSKTIIETDSAGVFYVLEYRGSGRIGWTVSHNILRELKSYGQFCILFINVTEEEMYIILESNKEFLESLDNQTGPYKIDKHDVEKYNISFENLDEYLISLNS